MTLREELEGLAGQLRQRVKGWVEFDGLHFKIERHLKNFADELVHVAARFPEAEKPAEPAHASAVTGEAVALLRRLAHVLDPASERDGLVEKRLRDWLWSEREALSRETKRLADRLAEAVPGGAEEGACARALRELLPLTERLEKDRATSCPECRRFTAEGHRRNCRFVAVLDAARSALSGAAASGDDNAVAWLRRVIGDCAPPLEGLHAAELDADGCALAPDLKDAIRQAVSTLRAAVKWMVAATAPPAPAPSAALTPEEEERIRSNPSQVLFEILAGSDAVPLLTLTPQQWREVTTSLYGRPAPSASPRRCLACNLLNPGSDHCLATQSGKHLFETEGEEKQADKMYRHVVLADVADQLRKAAEEVPRLRRSPGECDWLNAQAGRLERLIGAAGGNAPRRCPLCSEPESDPCPETTSGKHVFEAEGEPGCTLDCERPDCPCPCHYGTDDAPAIDSCPEMAELKEVIRAIAKEAAREEVASALARLMKPAPEEHVAPDTSGTRSKP